MLCVDLLQCDNQQWKEGDQAARPASTGVAHGRTARHRPVVEWLFRVQITRLEIPVALPTDQKVGGSSPSERANRLRRSGPSTGSTKPLHRSSKSRSKYYCHRSDSRVAAPPRIWWSGSDKPSRTSQISSRLNSLSLRPAAGFETTPIAAYGRLSSLASATSG